MTSNLPLNSGYNPEAMFKGIQSYFVSFDEQQWSMFQNDCALTVGVLGIVSVWLLIWQQLTSRNIISRLVSRKIIHLTCGPAFIYMWQFYSDAESAKYIAATIPLLLVSLLVISGKSKSNSWSSITPNLGQMISRAGKAADALGGPLYYTLVLLFLTLSFFKQPVAVVTVMQLCVGDALAEIMGRKFGAACPWPMKWAKSKSVVGSVAFALSAYAASVLALHLYDVDVLSQPQLLTGLAIVSIACAGIELAPVHLVGDDNLAIAGMAILTSSVVFGN